MAIASRPSSSRERVAETRKWVTLLFTDIVDSTRHWNEQGDIEARLQVDKHDRLLEAVVNEFHGTLVKTIGDSLMVTFEDPDNAIRAAIAMQHQLEEERQKDSDFELAIRIGLHRGVALVEENDVYGNTVNVASRVESRAEGGEILVTDAVITAVDRERYQLKRIGSFTPKGKTTSILLYRVSWWRDESRIDPIEPASRAVEPAKRMRKRSLGLAKALVLLALASAGVAAVAAKVLPPVLVEYPGWASLLLNPMTTASTFARELAAGSGALVVATWIVLRIRLTRGLAAALLRAGAAYAVVGLGLYGAIQALPASLGWPDERSLFAWVPPETRWVEVRRGVAAGAATAEIREGASTSSKLVEHARPGDRYVLARTSADGTNRWLQIHLSPGRLGWLLQGSDHSAPAHAIAPAQAIELGEGEALACACGLLAALGAALGGRGGKRE